MKTLPSAVLIRNTFLAVAAVSAMALPLLASATTHNIAVSFSRADLDSNLGQERLYQQLKTASRELCGSSDYRASGSLSQSIENEKCYSGTLTAAVERLDIDAITVLHSE